MNPFPLIKKTWQYELEQISRCCRVPLAKPRGSDLIVTYRCNFQCRHCDIWREHEHRELTTKQWFKVIDEMRRWLGRGYLVSVGGGEPLLRHDILDILNYLSRKDFQVILESNGYLIDERLADWLVRSGLQEVRISLYSLKPEWHNSWRHNHLAHERAMRALSTLFAAKRHLESPIKISIGLLIHKENIGGEALELIKWANQNGYSVTLQALDENFRNGYQNSEWYHDNPLWPNQPAEVKSFFEQVITLKQSGALIDNSFSTLGAFRDYFLNPRNSCQLSCAVAYRSLNLDPEGRPFFCYKTGVLEESAAVQKLSKLWSAAALKQKRAAVAQCLKICRLRCYYRDSLREKVKAKIGTV